jgi:hypothetical protein
MNIRDLITNNRFKVLGLLIVTIMSMVFLSNLSNLGKNRVTLRVIPEESRVSINNNVVDSDVKYLKKGWYEFKAEVKGFKKDTQRLYVNKDVTVNLLPEPNSDQAYQWLNNNPSIQQKREEMGGMRAAQIGENYIKKTPIRKLIPRVDMFAPYAMDYGVEGNNYDTFIEIHDSSPVGREKALQWIRQQGYNPGDLDIRYLDYNNPFSGGE